VYWGEFIEMFGTKPSRLDIMNESAPTFFHMVRTELSDVILLQLSRITDKPVVAGHKTLTIRNLPSLISDGTARLAISALVDAALEKTKTCRDHRNMLIAHDNLLLALQDKKAELVSAPTKREIDEALKAIAEVMRSVSMHLSDSDMIFDTGNPRVHGFVELLYVMRDGLKAREGREERLRAGKYTADDLKHEDL
jgi:AbiU2